jgi:deazaflavin-dependent oxidoreductase (nitroreductase family)
MHDHGANKTEAAMTPTSLESFADRQVLYLTTLGRKTGLPREIEIWFVVSGECLYLFAETGENAGWVKNIRRNPKVWIRIAEWRIDATARVLARNTDRQLWDRVAAIANSKYGWGDGLPVEVTPLWLGAPDADPVGQ